MPKFFNHNALDPFPLEKGSVNLVITSPPYFNLRDYKGDPRQIGQEPTPQAYVDKLLQVGRNVKDVLADDGSYWLNVGDTYDKNKSLWLIPHRVAIAMRDEGWVLRNTVIWHKPNHMPCSIKDRLTPSHEYVFFFSKKKKYYFDLDAIREPHQTLNASRYLHKETLAAKLGVEVKPQANQTLLDMEVIERKGYKNTKLKGETVINQGARWGFNRDGEHMENRYSDGGKNPGDVFLNEKFHFTKEDELRAVSEMGMIKGKTARTTARLYMGGSGGMHPLGKNPGDVHSLQTESGEIIEGNSGEWWFIDGFNIECPTCGSQFETSTNEFYTDNPDDLWHINTQSFKDSHFAVFPTTLVEKIVRCSSRVGDSVLDPFSGSGTTAIVAERLNRVGLGMDLSYNDVRERRVAAGIQQELIIE
jgi:DNA modification methylase